MCLFLRRTAVVIALSGLMAVLAAGCGASSQIEDGAPEPAPANNGINETGKTPLRSETDRAEKMPSQSQQADESSESSEDSVATPEEDGFRKSPSPKDKRQRETQDAENKTGEPPKETSEADQSDQSNQSEADAELPPPGPQSWPSFRNGNRQLGIAGSALPEKLELLWKHPVKHGVPEAAAIVGPHVYAGGLNGKVYCLDRKTGEVIWTYRSVDDSEEFAPGFKSSPRVTAETVYIGDEYGVLHALDRATGEARWTFTSDAEIIGCPAVVGKNVIFGSYDSFLYCLKAADGSQVWTFQTQDRINASPALVPPYTFVAGCDQHLRVVNIETGEQEGAIPIGTYLIASPAVRGDVLYVGTHAAEVLAVDWKQEEVLWRFRAEKDAPFHASAAVTDEFVLVGGRDKRMHCLNRQTGEQVWMFATRGRIDSSPVVVGERVFFGSADGNVYGLRIGDGKKVWKYNTGQEMAAAPAVGHGNLVIGSAERDGFLYCFGAK